MTTYTYNGEPDRYYPTLALTPEPGKTYELDEDPADGRWQATKPKGNSEKQKES